jgi:hypothetical protein
MCQGWTDIWFAASISTKLESLNTVLWISAVTAIISAVPAIISAVLAIMQIVWKKVENKGQAIGGR